MNYFKTAFYFIFLCGLQWTLAKGKSIDYQIDGKTYEGYYLAAKKNAPLVLLVHDWDGLTDYEIKRAESLNKLGYSVFAADLFGKGIRPTDDKDKAQHTGELYQDRVKLRKLLDGATDEATRLGANSKKKVAMGYCFGGAAVLELARAGNPFQGYVSFHGGLGTPEGQNYSQTQGKILVFHGTADAYIGMDQLAQLGSELEKDSVPHELISYGGAPHGFTVFNSPAYREDADKASWNRFTHFLREIF